MTTFEVRHQQPRLRSNVTRYGLYEEGADRALRVLTRDEAVSLMESLARVLDLPVPPILGSKRCASTVTIDGKEYQCAGDQHHHWLKHHHNLGEIDINWI